MAKVAIKSEIIATSGGIFHVMEVFERLGIDKLITFYLFLPFLFPFQPLVQKIILHEEEQNEPRHPDEAHPY